jgi:hypothetical protein
VWATADLYRAGSPGRRTAPDSGRAAAGGMSGQATPAGGTQTQRGGVSPVAGPQGALAGAPSPAEWPADTSRYSRLELRQAFLGPQPRSDLHSWKAAESFSGRGPSN